MATACRCSGALTFHPAYPGHTLVNVITDITISRCGWATVRLIPWACLRHDFGGWEANDHLDAESCEMPAVPTISGAVTAATRSLPGNAAISPFASVRPIWTARKRKGL